MFYFKENENLKKTISDKFMFLKLISIAYII